MRLSLFIKFSITLLLLIQSFAASARDACLLRAWQGTLAKTPVVLEFVEKSDGDVAGHYYYRTKLDELLLEADDPTWDAWRELDAKGNITGYFKNVSCSSDSLTAEWHSPDGKTKLSVSAKPIKNFQQPRLDGLKLSEGKLQQQGALSYQLLEAAVLPEIEFLRFSAKTPALEKLNQHLRTDYFAAIGELLDCNSQALFNQSVSCDLSEGWEVKTANTEFLVLSHFYDSYMGGAHPSSDTRFLTYSLQSGELVEVAAWLIAQYQSEIPKDSPLGKLILKQYLAGESAQEGCEQDISFYAHNLWPAEKGLQFEVSTSHVMRFCEDTVAIPYAVLWPFLSEKGRHAAGVFGFSK